MAMTILGCKWHPGRDNVGVCAVCLQESLSRLAALQDDDDESIDLEIFPPSKPSSESLANRRAQFILVQHGEDANHGGMAGESSIPYTGGNSGRAMRPTGRDRSYQPYYSQPSDFSLDGTDHSDRQGEASTSEGSSGGQTEANTQNIQSGTESGEPSFYKRKLRSSNGRRKPKSWGAAMLKMVGLRTLSVLWRSDKKSNQASSSKTKPTEYEENCNFEAPTHYQQRTPPRFSVSSVMEQTTPTRYSVSSQWEQRTPARYSVASIHEQITPARYSGASLFDIESMDSRRFSTSSRGSPYVRPLAGTHNTVNGDNFTAAWRASQSGANGRKMGALEGLGGALNELHPVGENYNSTFSFGTRDYGHEDRWQGRDYAREAGQAKKSSWKWLSPFRGALKDRKEMEANFDDVAAELNLDSGVQEKPRKSTSSSVFGSKSRDRNSQPLSPKLTPKPTPKLSGKKSPWWRASPHIRALKSPSTISAKTESLDQEVAISTDSDLMDDTPHRLSSASPHVGYSRSSSNPSSCFTTPRWNTRQRMHHGSRIVGVQEIDREYEITHLAI